MAINKRLLVKPPSAGGITPSEHFGVVLYEGDGSTSHSINGGKFGAAFYGNGSSSKIDIGNLNLGGDAERTISAWINTNSLSSTQTIFQYGANSNKARFGFAIDTSGKPFVEYYDRDVITSSSHISVNTWYHLVVTYNGNAIETATNTQIYVNGSAVSMTTSGAQTGSANTTDSNYGIGYDRLNTRQYFSGKLDQVRIFQKALSSSEVSTLYAETVDTVESLDPLSEDTTDTLQVLGDSSCIATYRFENDEVDLSGNYNGTGTAIQYAAGRYGQAASFNGTSSKVDITATASTPIDFSQRTFTLSAWINGSGFTTDDRTIIGKYNGSNNTGSSFFFDISDSDQKLRVTEVNGTSALGFKSSATISENIWTHVVYVRTATTCEFFINGSSSGGSQSRTTALNAGGTTDISIGERQANKRFIGKIDQVRIFNKALSAAEVTTLYNENSLVASYRFEGNANDDMRAYDGSATNVTYEYGLNFTPDFVWLKNRDVTRNHRLVDSTRGATKHLIPNLTNAESNTSTNVASFDSGGFTVNTAVSSNENGSNFVAWCLKANGGTTSSNTDGTITSTVQANQDSGFSIVQYTGTGSNTTIGHGLSAVPEMIIAKSTSDAYEWKIWHKDLSSGYQILFNTAAQASDSSVWTTTTPTSTVFSVGTNVGVNQSAKSYIAYCFHSVDSFSKFGTYTGNGSTNGPIVETGFEPAFIMTKQTNTASNWVIVDNKRSTTNPRDKGLRPNTTDTEATVSNNMVVDFLSNGFQLKQTSGANDNGGTFIYMAFAADPDTEAPTVAKSFSTVTYTGTGSSQTIEGLGFEPSLIWIKGRSAAYNHNLIDVVRGKGSNNTFLGLASDLTDAELNSANNVSLLNSDGFTITGGGTRTNASGADYVAWAWKADDNEPTIFGGPAVAVYKFEDNANDVTGNYNSTASANITYDSNGKFNKAADFNGLQNSSASYIDISSSTTSPVSSISFWVKSTTKDSNVGTFIDAGGGSSSNTGFSITRAATTGYIRLTFTNGSVGNTQVFNGTTDVCDGSWHHIVLSMANNNTFVLYLDGESHITGTRTRFTTANSHNLSNNRFGTNAASIGASSYDGLIDQVRIYNGAVSDIGVAALYAETVSDNDDLTLGGPPETIISANANAGFSIVKYEGNGVSGTKIPHGLSAAPEFIITKRLDSNASGGFWYIYSSVLGTTKTLVLNGTNAQISTSNSYLSVGSTTYEIGTNGDMNTNGGDFIAYCFHSVSGYSKFGSYTGTANSNTVTTGFQPDFIMIKQTSASGQNWIIHDSVRTGNPHNQYLMPSSSAAESSASSTNAVNFLSNGFELIGTGNATNGSGATYIYAAFKIN